MALYTFDPSHSEAAFVARHMMFTKVRGALKITRGELNFDPANPTASSVEVELDAASIKTGDGNRDNHLRSADFLEVETYPTITFKSTRVVSQNGKTGQVYGDLTIHGVTREVAINAEFLGEQKDPWGNNRVVFNGSTTINREDWGLKWNVALEAGGWLVSKDIEIELDVQALPAKVAEASAN